MTRRGHGCSWKNDSPAIGDQFGSEEKPAKRGLFNFGECFYFSQKQSKGIFVAVYAFFSPESLSLISALAEERGLV